MAQPLVSVIIPALNEAADIAGCIEAIGAQDYPMSSIEVLVVDGASPDGTAERAREAVQRFAFERFAVLTNERARTSRSLNVALDAAKGEFVVRVDARSRVQPDYVRLCVEVLQTRPEIGEVGGAQVARPRSDAALEVGLARAQRNRLTSGLSRYRRANVAGSAEHVWMGAFRTDELRRIGGWDDATALNEDFELSQRYIESGRVVWFDARLQSDYLARPSIVALGRQHFYFGRVKGMWWARGRRPLPRQLALLAVPPAAVAAAALSARTIGLPRTVAAGAAAVFAIEAVGCTGPAGGGRVRGIAALAIATYSMSWWTGTIVGFVGEMAGVEHRHR
jgi:glycosyltransferase involved in cell wall biosynthesis